jgi:hypothetical protein
MLASKTKIPDAKQPQNFESARDHILWITKDTKTDDSILFEMAVQYKEHGQVFENIAGNFAASFRTLRFVIDNTESGEVQRTAWRTIWNQGEAYDTIRASRRNAGIREICISHEDVVRFMRAERLRAERLKGLFPRG